MNNKVELLKNGIKEKLNKAQEEHKNGVDKSEGTADGFMLILGICLILAYILVYYLSRDPDFSPNKQESFKTLETITQLIMVAGITFCANSIYSLYRRKKILKRDEIIYNEVNEQIDTAFERTECFKWLNKIEDEGITAIINSGLVNVYKDWNNVYEIMKKYLKEKKESICEIICYDGLADFRSTFDVDTICEEYLNNGLQLKILSANPNVSHWTQHEIDMHIKLDARKEFDVSPPHDKYKAQICELKVWYDDILKRQAKSKIVLKYHSSLPSLSLIRMNNRLFLSGKLIGGDTDVSRPPIFEYTITDIGNADELIYYQYKKYFECLWNDPDLATVDQELLIKPQLLINNKVINLILKNTCNAMTEILRAACPHEYMEHKFYPLKTRAANPIKALFTVLDYAEPYESSGARKITRRYNTNRVNRKEGDIGINDCNGNNNLEGKGYPISASHAIGYVMIYGKGFFKTTDPQKEPQDLDNQSCISLVLPLKSKKKNIIDYVHEGSITRDRIDIPDNREFNGQIENNYCKTSTNVFATLTFEFDNNIKHIIIPDEAKNNEDIIDYNSRNGFTSQFEGYTFNTKLVSWRLIKEAERCQKLLLEYFGFDSGTANDADILMAGKLD